MSLTVEMVRVQIGVSGAFEILYKAHFPKLRAFFVRLGFPAKPANRESVQMRRKAWADDLAHETMVAVWEDRLNYDGVRASFETWSYGIALNTARREWKRLGRFTDPDPEFFQAIPVADHTPGREWVRQLLQRGMGELSLSDRSCIVLMDMTGLSDSDASPVLGESVSATGVRHSRARKRLRMRVEGYLRNESLVSTTKGAGSPQCKNDLLSELTCELILSDDGEESQGSQKASTKKGVGK